MAIVHNVQVYPIYAGHVNDHKVLREREFATKEQALDWIKFRGNFESDLNQKSVYTGAIDTETGDNL